MDIKTSGNLLALVKRVLDTSTGTEPMIESVNIKPPCPMTPPLHPLERCLPEEVGISSVRLYEFLRALEDEESLDMHNVMVVRHGKVICEASFSGYDSSLWHVSHSCSKTVTMLAVGMLIDEGKLSLDTRPAEVLKSKIGLLSQVTHKQLTVKHLLTMTAGVQFGETGSVTERDWLKCWFESPPQGDVGTKFFYNSMNTYVLSAMVREITGSSLTDYLRPRLFDVLGIDTYWWEKCPMGIECGGWGLYLRPEDMAKLGMLILGNGVYGGKRVVSEKRLKEAMRVHAEVPKEYGNFDYGCGIWLSRDPGVVLINGMFGQNVLCDTKSDTVCVTNAGNMELFQQTAFFELYDKYIRSDNVKALDRYGDFTDKPIIPKKADVLTSALTMAADAYDRFVNNVNIPNIYASLAPGQRMLKMHEMQLNEYGETRVPESISERRRNLEALKANLTALHRRTFTTIHEEAASAGLVPLYRQVMSGRYTGGITHVGFVNTSDGFVLAVKESGEMLKIPIGFEKPKRSSLTVSGEKHEIAAFGEFTPGENSSTLLKIRLSFIEYSSSRFIRFTFKKNGEVTMKLTEQPGCDYISGLIGDALKRMMNGKREHPILEALHDQTSESGYISYRLKLLFEPELKLIPRTKNE